MVIGDVNDYDNEVITFAINIIDQAISDKYFQQNNVFRMNQIRI